MCKEQFRNFAWFCCFSYNNLDEEFKEKWMGRAFGMREKEVI
jgi:hypothetical protein